MRRFCLPGLMVAAGVLAGVCRWAPAEERYWALFADGAERTAGRIDRWDGKEQPTIAGRALFDKANPVRVIRDTRLEPSAAGSRLLFANGDILPGRVVGFGPAKDYPGQPACLSVAAQPPLRHAKGQSVPIRVRPECLQRVVLGQARGASGGLGSSEGPYRPGTLVFANGQALLCQAVRWVPGGLFVLTDKGIRSFTLDDLAEIHMPAADAAQHVLNDATGPCPEADSLVGRVTTAQGAALTFRQAMLVRQRYWLLVQPAWCLDAIQVWLHDVCFLSFRRPNEVPLSLLPAETLQQKSFTGFVWPWQRNRSVRGGVLESGNLSSDLGVGTHSYSAVAFRLPPGARALSFLAGLDRAVADRGCVKLKVYRDKVGGRLLWQSGFLRGRDKPVRVGGLDCRKAKRLVLVTEYGHRGRPAGADPVDIRDEVNWLVPTVRLDPAALARYVGSPLRHFAGLETWSLSPADAAKTSVGAKWDASHRHWEPLLNVPPTGLALTRKVHIPARAPFLWMTALGEDVSHILSVWINGQQLECANGAPHFEAARYPNSRQWDLRDYADKEAALAVKIRPGQAGPAATGLRRLAILFRQDPALVPTSQRRPQPWRYTTRQPGGGWQKLGFDDSAWKEGQGAFGTRGRKGVRTEWQGRSIWLRRAFELQDTRVGRLYLNVMHGDSARVYINGRLAAALDSHRDSYTSIPVSAQAVRVLKTGRNVLAVHCRNSHGEQFIDVGLVAEGPE